MNLEAFRVRLEVSPRIKVPTITTCRNLLVLAVLLSVVTTLHGETISDTLTIKKHDGTVVDSTQIIDGNSDSETEGAVGLTVKTLAEGLNVTFNSPTTAYILEQNMSAALVVSDMVTLNIHQDPDQKLMVDFDFLFTSDPHSGLTVPDGTPESQLFTENDGTQFDITFALFPVKLGGAPFIVIATSDLDPVPEPTAFILVATGLCGLAVLRARSRWRLVQSFKKS